MSEQKLSTTRVSRLLFPWLLLCLTPLWWLLVWGVVVESGTSEETANMIRSAIFLLVAAVPAVAAAVLGVLVWRKTRRQWALALVPVAVGLLGLGPFLIMWGGLGAFVTLVLVGMLGAGLAAVVGVTGPPAGR